MLLAVCCVCFACRLLFGVCRCVCSLSAVRGLMFTVGRCLFVDWCVLLRACCVLVVGSCVMFVVRCLLSVIVRCLVLVVFCSASVVGCA